MSSKKAHCCCLLMLMSFWAQAQSVLKGKVSDSQSGEALFSAVVGEKGTTNGTTTGFDGEFSLKVNTIPTIVIVNLVGYESYELTISSAASLIDIKLKSTEALLGEVNIVSDRLLEKQKKSPLTMESMDAIAIKEAPTGNFYEGLAALKGVDMASASLAFRVINTRGFNSTSPVRVLQLIDGVDNQSPGLNFSLGNFLGAPDLDVKSVDIIQGASSAYFGPGAFNGVINMETKNPFLNTGLSVALKVGERSLFQPSVRWAEAIKNKEGHAWFAYKLNLFYLTAQDWRATNYNPIYGSAGGQNNPGRYDAVNIYGDEYFGAFDYAGASPYSPQYRGLGTFYRTGYREEDLVDYNTENFKSNLALHFRLKPELDYESPELILQGNQGQGTTVYQGDNRFSLRDIKFYQAKAEIRKKDKYFLRLYATTENAGRSFDPYFTALKLRDDARSQENWANVYIKNWQTNIIPKMDALGYPGLVQNPNPINFPFDFFLPYDYAAYNNWNSTYSDSLALWHSQVEQLTNNGNAGIPSIGADGYYEPGSDKFKENFEKITSARNNQSEGGTRFYDRSSLFHIHGEYKWSFKQLDELRVGANSRLYRPNSDGTIFTDTAGTRITNLEFGVYAGAEKKLLEDKLILSATLRIDKNQNFDALLSPAISAVYNPKKNHYFRASYSSALRNPTLSDQYLNLNVGPAILGGNLNGVDSLITLDSFGKFRNSQNRNDLEYFNIAPIKPEQARSLELGYRGTFFEKIFVDASIYTTFYENFIGFQIGLEADFDATGNLIFNSIQPYRYSANSTNRVITQGANVGVSYYFYKSHSFTSNYSYNKLAKADDSDPIIPAFNTPLHKFNIGFSGRDLFVSKAGNSWGYGINYKWVDNYFWEGSPQFTGPVPSFDVMDAQINYTLKKQNLNFKLGGSNVLTNEHIEAYGGPMIGRLLYINISYEWKKD